MLGKIMPLTEVERLERTVVAAQHCLGTAFEEQRERAEGEFIVNGNEPWAETAPGARQSDGAGGCDAWSSPPPRRLTSDLFFVSDGETTRALEPAACDDS